jgi:transcriptional regulator with XRE-family HTH domain
MKNNEIGNSDVLDDLSDSTAPLGQPKLDAKIIIAGKIKDAMKEREWKGKDLLAALKKEFPSVIIKWHSGTQNFTVDTLVQLEQVLNIKLLDLDDNDIKDEFLDKLQTVVPTEPGKWHEDSEFRHQNKQWLKRSHCIAVRISRTLRAKGLSQKDLAIELGVSPQLVSKWVNGKDNFTFETVEKLEKALNIELMSVMGFWKKS